MRRQRGERGDGPRGEHTCATDALPDEAYSATEPLLCPTATSHPGALPSRAMVVGTAPGKAGESEATCTRETRGWAGWGRGVVRRPPWVKEEGTSRVRRRQKRIRRERSCC
jgi:hypothetical protein